MQGFTGEGVASSELGHCEPDGALASLVDHTHLCRRRRLSRMTDTPHSSLPA